VDSGGNGAVNWYVHEAESGTLIIPEVQAFFPSFVLLLPCFWFAFLMAPCSFAVAHTLEENESCDDKSVAGRPSYQPPRYLSVMRKTKLMCCEDRRVCLEKVDRADLVKKPVMLGLYHQYSLRFFDLENRDYSTPWKVLTNQGDERNLSDLVQEINNRAIALRSGNVATIATTIDTPIGEATFHPASGTTAEPTFYPDVYTAQVTPSAPAFDEGFHYTILREPN